MKPSDLLTTRMRCEKKHIAVVPFPFASHPMALAEHALRLAEAASNVSFSFINIPSSNASIFFHSKRHLIPTNLKLYDIVAPPSGLNLEEESEWYHTNALQSYEAVIEKSEVETGVPVSCLLTDFLTASASEIATKMGVKWIAFWVSTPLNLLAHVHTHAITDHLVIGGRFDLAKSEIMKKKSDFVPGLSKMRVEDLPVHIFESITGSTDSVVKVLAEIGTVLPKADAVVINCFAEENLTEPASVLRSKVKTLLQIGFPLTKWGQRNLDDDVDSDSDPSGCLSWLDQQSRRPKSVVYVSFGSVSWLSPVEISDIAVTLEKTKTPYLWSLKDQSHLPTGFVERTSSYGKLVVWAPQTLVLSHPSVGAHIMHAGFNSIFESVVAEVPMIFRPIWADNMMNARMAEEVWQIGVCVEGRVITINGLIKCLEMVLAGEQGKWMRHNIKVLKGVIVDASASNGSATKDFNSLVELISSN